MMSAAALPAEDARLILARRTAEQLEGGRLARLSPMRRRGLERLSTRLGLREFDASLVIAIAQDAARNGERVESNAVGGRLQMVREPTSPARGGAWAWRLASATALAAVMLLGLVRWVGGA